MLSQSQIKYIRSLHNKKYRQRHGAFVAEGSKVVREFLQSSFKIDAIYSMPEWIDKNHSLLNKGQVKLTEIDQKELAKISTLSSPSEVLAVVMIPEYPDKKAFPDQQIHLVLEDIQDPGNMGTIIRTADWFGLKTIFCSENSVDVYNPKVVQGSMGSLSRVSVRRGDLVSMLKGLKNRRIYSAMISGESIYNVKYSPGSVLIVGNETRGVTESLGALADQNIAIPGSGSAESLNAAVATGIILSHFLK